VARWSGDRLGFLDAALSQPPGLTDITKREWISGDEPVIQPAGAVLGDSERRSLLG
jgi:hypothetical protein